MNQELPTEFNSAINEITEELCEQIDIMSIPEVTLQAIATQIYTAREARQRIEKEGSVVRDTKGSVVPHPAIKIEADAMKIYTGLLAKHSK